jgi:methyl acetate hydrolase
MENNRRIVLKSLAAFAALPTLWTSVFAAAAEMSTADRGLRDAASTGKVPGIVAGVTNSKETIFTAAHGVRGLGETLPIRNDTVFYIASMTKPLTSVAAMQLVEQGKIKLDEPVGKYVPELANLNILEGYNPDGTPKLRPAKTQVTLRQLLTHTSGFAYDIWDENILKYYKIAGLPPLSGGTKKALEIPLVFESGTDWKYGPSLDWTGVLIENISGLRLGQYLERNVTGPIGMKDTAFFIRPDMRERLSKMHSRQNDSKLSVIPFEYKQDPDEESGGAGMYSTAPDYLKFMQMILNKGRANGTQILSARTVTEHLSKNAMGDIRVKKLKTAIPFLSNDAEFFPGVEKTWSTGFMINETQAFTGRSAGSLAWAGLANTYFWIDPKRDIAGVVMMQLLPFADKMSLDIFYDFEKSVYSSLT